LEHFMASVEDEASLISKAVAGDLPAVQKLLLRHRKRLVAYVQSHFPDELRNTLDPQDIVQDTWLRAIRSLSEFKHSTSDPVYRWLVTIARNVIADQLRYVRRLKRKGMRVQTNRGDENRSVVRLLEELALYQRTPSKSAASRELMAALDSAIERLPPDQGQALRLRYLARLDITDIAKKMNRTAGSISMLCNRALKSLRGEMRSMSLYV
jgi:RNA polymerase sigma-70 factor (ECF subfamily)